MLWKISVFFIQLLIEIDDITEQITYQRLIEESHDFLNKITAKVPIVLFQYTINAHRNIHFTFISQELERLFSTMTIENFYDKPNSIFEIIHPLDKLKLFKKYHYNVKFLYLYSNDHLAEYLPLNHADHLQMKSLDLYIEHLT